MFRNVFRNLVDQELVESERNQIISIIRRFKEVMGIHDMKTRYAANKVFIQCHIEMDGEVSLYNSHLLTEKIVEALLQKFPGADVIIHQDPFGYEEQVGYRENIN
jgi:divalent metal cation (Fe/Co/Zn/Cd) transporter